MQLLSEIVIMEIIPFLRVFLLLAVLVKPLITVTPYSLLLLLLLLLRSILHLLLLLVLRVETRWLRIPPLRVPLLLHLLLSLSFSLSSHGFLLDFAQLLYLSLLIPIAIVLLSIACCLVALWLLALKISTVRISSRRHHILLLLLEIHILLATLLLWLLLLLLAVPVLNLCMLLLTHHTTWELFLTVYRLREGVRHGWLGRCVECSSWLSWLTDDLSFDFSWL